MKTITYKFVDGTCQTVEVTDEIFAVHEQLVQEEKRNHWKNTRRHISLTYLNEHEIDIEDTSLNVLDRLIEQEREAGLKRALEQLPDKQRKLLENVFFDEMTLTQIAEVEGVSQPAISQRLATALKNLKKHLEQTL